MTKFKSGLIHIVLLLSLYYDCLTSRLHSIPFCSQYSEYKMLNNSSTVSPGPAQDQFDPHMAFRVVMGIIAVVAFCSNGLLVATLLYNKALLRTPYNVLILSLAVTDMTTG